MPNWCANSLKLTATTADSEKKLAEIVQELARAKEARDNANFFAIIKPIPEALHITAGFLGHGTPEQEALTEAENKNLKEYGYKNWYDFCVQEWGSKWDAKTCDEAEPFEVYGNQVTIFFDTAWAPPMGIYYALEDMGFKVEATYVEQGMGYIGFYADGVDTCDKMEQFHEDDQDDEDFFDGLYEKISTYFTRRGFDHAPTNFGG